jgi:ABC-type multidrug transport system fused ATPase/permease subunit
MTDLFAIGLLPFSIAILLMFGIALLEGVGMLLGASISSAIDAIMPDFDVDVDIEVSQNGLTKLLGWMNVGRVPLLIIIVAFLTVFGLVGFVLQFFVYGLIGIYLNIFIAVAIALVVSLPFTRFFTNVLQKILPQDETSAISSSDFIGKVVTITLGQATLGTPAEAKFTDKHGQTHYLMVEPEEDGIVFRQGESIILSKENNSGFYAIKNENKILN